jgi:hypothetical protein
MRSSIIWQQERVMAGELAGERFLQLGHLAGASGRAPSGPGPSGRLAFIARCIHMDLPDASHQVVAQFVAQFVAHGFAGAITAWLSDDPGTKTDLAEAAVACAPAR